MLNLTVPISVRNTYISEKGRLEYYFIISTILILFSLLNSF
jgi:hypothetical protein